MTVTTMPSAVSENDNADISEFIDLMGGLDPICESVISDTSSDNGSKRGIQRKLESWQKLTPSSEILQFKLDTASLRRETKLMKKVIATAKYTNGVKERAYAVSTQTLIKSADLREHLQSKQISTLEKKQSLLHNISTRIKEERNNVLEAKEAMDTRKADERAALKKTIEDRRAQAFQNKDDTLKAMAAKIKAKFDKLSDSKVNNDEQIKALEEKLQKKYHSALVNKEKLIQDITANFQEKRNTLSSKREQEIINVQDLREKHEQNLARATIKREKVLKDVTQRSLGKKEQDSNDSIQKIKVIEDKIIQKQTLATKNKAQLTQDIKSKIQEKMSKVSSVHVQKTVMVDTLQSKLEEKYALASAKKEKLLKDASEKSLIKKERYANATTKKLIGIEIKSKQKQILAAGNKESFVQSMTVKIQEKMDKILSIQAQKAATVGELEGKLMQKHALASTKKESLLKNVSEKSAIQKEKYSQAFLQKIETLETKINQKQLTVAENKENITLNITSKIEQKMAKISSVQAQKIATIDVLDGKLKERHALVSFRKENVLKNISQKPLIQKERYSEASIQKLKTMEEELEKKQTAAAKNKENLVQSITTRLQEKTNKVSRIQSKKIESVEILQDKLYEKHALASTKKENVLKDVSQKPKAQKEKYSTAALQKVKELGDKLNQKHAIAAENKKQIEQSRVAELQAKMDRVSSVQVKQAEVVEALQEKIRGKHARISNKKLLLSKSMSDRSLGSISQCSTFSIQEVQEQKVKAIEEKLEKKHAIAAENKEKVAQSITEKIQEKMNKVMSVQAQHIVAANALQEKVKEKHAVVSMNKENMLKGVSKKIQLKKERVAMSNITNVSVAQSIEAKYNAKMKAAGLQKDKIVARVKEKTAKANRDKLIRLREVQEEKRQKTETLEVHHKTKLITAAQRKNNILSDISNNVSFDSTQRVKDITLQRTELENKIRLKHEAKLNAAERRRTLMLELENEKRELKRSRRENILKMKMISRQRKQANSSGQNDTRLTRLEEKNEDKENQSCDAHCNEEGSTVVSELEARRIEFRAQAAEEIQSAREVKRAELMRYAEEREQGRQRKEMLEEGDSFDQCISPSAAFDRGMSLSTESTGSESFDWEEEVCYADPFADQHNPLEDIRLEPHTASADIVALNNATQDLARAIRACDVKLSDIQVMQSIILAEEAAYNGTEEFKTVERLPELDTVKMSFSTTTSRSQTDRKPFGSRIGNLSKRVAPRLTARITNVSRRARPVLASRIGGISNKTRGGLKVFQNAASKISERRRHRQAMFVRPIEAQ